MKKPTFFLLVFLCSLSVSADFRVLMDLLPEISGYSASTAEGSSLPLPRGDVDTASREYSSEHASLRLSIYSGADVHVLEEHGIKAGNVTRTEKYDNYTAMFTGSGYNKGYITLTSGGSPLTVVLEYKGIEPEKAADTLRSINPERFFKAR
jgi:hypothetical protein